jgi:GTP cyclohydrolase I
MPTKQVLSWEDVHLLAMAYGGRIAAWCGSTARIYPVPRGGIHAAQAILRAAPPNCRFTLVNSLHAADVIVDDIIDSGKTKARYQKIRDLPFVALVNKLTDPASKDTWYVFPWEDFPDEPKGESEGPKDAVIRLLQFIGEDPKREGLQDTPKRVIKSYGELFGGYKLDPADAMTTFEDGACDEMVILKAVEFVSFCEHHMLPFIGQAHIAYVPNGKVIGVSKLARVLDIFARRLQIQERISKQVTAALMEHLQPKGAACVIESRHLCMVCRGVQKQHSVMVTSSLEGVFKTDPATRAEFMSMIR